MLYIDILRGGTQSERTDQWKIKITLPYKTHRNHLYTTRLECKCVITFFFLSKNEYTYLVNKFIVLLELNFLVIIRHDSKQLTGATKNVILIHGTYADKQKQIMEHLFGVFQKQKSSLSQKMQTILATKIEKVCGQIVCENSCISNL